MKRSLQILRTSICLLLVAGAGLAKAQVPANPYDYTRTSSFAYWGASDGAKAGLLKTETVEPDNVQSCVVTTYDYDAYGNKASASTANCGTVSDHAQFTGRTSYATYGTQSVGGVTSQAGIFLTRSTNALSQSEDKTYDPRFGVMVSLKGPNQLTTTWQVDDFGRKVKELRADGTSTLTAYCVLASPSSNSSTGQGDPLDCPQAPGDAPADAYMFVQSEPHDSAGAKSGPFVRVYTDHLGREIRTVTENFDGTRLIARDTVYSKDGPKSMVTQPFFLDSGSSTTTGSGDVGVTRTEYDVLGRPTAIYVADPDGNGTSPGFGTYNASHQAAVQTLAYSGLAVTTTNDKGQTRTEEKNAIGEVVRVTDAVGAKLAHQRDAFGNLVATKDALGNQITFAYDIRGRKLQMNDPDAGTWKYDYDALGELVWQQSPNQLAAGTQTTLTYDVLGRLTVRTEPDLISNWYYDTRANRASCAQGSATSIGKLCETNTNNGINRKMVYDTVGRPINTRTTVSSGPSFASAVSYDNASRLATQTYPTGLQVAYAYTATGYLQKLTTQTAATVNPLPNSSGTTAANGTLAAGAILWQAQAVNAWGRAEKQAYGNGVAAQADYEAATGRTTDLTAGLAGDSTGVVSYHYTWDSLNNLQSRMDNNGDTMTTGASTGAVNETFNYDDGLNRLTGYTVSAPAMPGLTRTVTLQYNALGMLLNKSDVGNYTYPSVQGPGSVRPHALQSVDGASPATYTYDANGNLTGASNGPYGTISYTSFNLPDSQGGLYAAGGRPKYLWLYDENHARFKEVHTASGGTQRTTWFLHPDNQGGLAFESETTGTTTSNRHYLSAGGAVVGVLVSKGSLPSLNASQTAPTVLSSITLVKVEYWHKDHLGSLVATTDHLGNVTQRYAYDPFGKRRYANGTYDDAGNLIVDWSNSLNWGTDRGFTGHEHLDDVGLVHMNGRIFDPTLGVFLQADPMLQDPLNLQNYNRYGYCYNNPLTCTDPTGYFFGIDDIAFGYLMTAIFTARAVGLIDTQQMRLASSIALAAFMGPGGTGALFGNSIESAATAGFFSGAVASGNLKGALQGAFSAGVFYGVGNVVGGKGFFAAGADKATSTAWGTPAGVALHAVAGCVTSAAAGNKCGPGALSAAFSKWAAPHTVGLGREGGAIASAVIGGTASVLGGGKFQNGAVTAAFSYLFNDWAHQLELARYGREAHTLLQDYMEKLGYITESKCATYENCVNGRFDIADARTKEVWEIKRDSFTGIMLGGFALNDYTAPETGLHRGANLIGLAVEQKLSIWSGFVEYEFTNRGQGLITYNRNDYTPNQPTQVYVPTWMPMPGGGGRRNGRYEY